MRNLTCILFFTMLSVVVNAQQSRVNVGVDERVELLTTVQLLSGYEWLTKADLTYKKEVLTAFDKYKKHKAVAYYQTISPRFYGYQPLLLIGHYQLPTFQQVGMFTEQDQKELKYSAYKDTLETFVQLLKDFYVTSDFHSFFVAHKPYYDSISLPIARQVELHDYIGVMEAHFGASNAGYNIVLSPLQMDAGFGPMITTKNGNILYAVTGSNYNSGTFPIFDEDALFKELVIHEFCHSFCNPLVDSFYDQLERDSLLLMPILKEQQEQGYGNWKSCLYEHLTRANEIVLTGLIYGEEAANQQYKQQVEEDKWVYLTGLVPLVREYHDNRRLYTNQYMLMPKVVAYMDEEKEKLASKAGIKK